MALGQFAIVLGAPVLTYSLAAGKSQYTYFLQGHCSIFPFII